ncbi:Predicted transporter component [Salmonella enterica subsp. enterica]|nr:Predicted transporter component [Salmonella enterica subsp. enterica]
MVSDCPQSINNIPLDARNHGYTVLDIQQDGPTIRYLIQKISAYSRCTLRRETFYGITGKKSTTHKRNQNKVVLCAVA